MHSRNNIDNLSNIIIFISTVIATTPGSHLVKLSTCLLLYIYTSAHVVIGRRLHGSVAVWRVVG